MYQNYHRINLTYKKRWYTSEWCITFKFYLIMIGYWFEFVPYIHYKESLSELFL